MREIKFRAWDKKEQTMWNANHPVICGGTPMLYSGTRYEVGENKVTLQSFVERPDIILMQFTGLKDKNGKDVFEGDIVETDEDRMEVRFIGDHGGLHRYSFVGVTHEGPTKDTIHTLPAKECEIIGNIYENPELLK